MQKSHSRSIGLFQLWFWLIMNFFGWIIVGSLGCLVVSVVIVALYGERVGFDILQNLIQQDYAYLLQTTKPNTDLLVNHWLYQVNTRAVIPKGILSHHLGYMPDSFNTLWLMLRPYVSAIQLGLNLLVIRVFLILKWYPLFLLLGLAGLIDGLAQRSIRRSSVGRESALIYHHAKPLIMLSLICGIFIDLVCPIPIEQAVWVMAISAIFFGLAIQISSKSFKKYL